MTDADKKRNKRFVAKILDYKKTFNSESGKKVLNDLIKNHNFLSSSAKDETNTNMIYFREGERNVIIRLLKMLSIDPDEIQTRIREIEKDDNSN